jgi:predicted metal-dependent phosphotriesterase family hydrolase
MDVPNVETVSGPVDVEELGLTLIHEHFRTTVVDRRPAGWA